jgi:hypothetical protein
MSCKIDSNDTILVVTILITIFVFYVVYPFLKKNNEQFDNSNKINDILKNIEIIDNYPKQNNKDKDNIVRLDKNICSKQCCKYVQWPVPFNTKNPKISDEILNNFIPSNFGCNGGESGGCVCLSKNDYNYLSEHGQR